jgi:protease IV
MTFFRSFFASLLALVVFGILSVLFIIIVMAGIVASTEEKVLVRNNSVLHLKLDAEISEMEIDNPFAGLPFGGNDVPQIGLIQLKGAIKHAKTDDKIKGIYVDVSYPLTGFASIEEIRESLIDFRQSGKWVIAYSEVMTETAYYLSSAADKVYLYPEGEIELNGLAIELVFFKRMFDKLEIKPQVFRVGEFKSAVEPFLLEKMSPENRLQQNEMIESMNNYMLKRIAEARNIPLEKLTEISDKMLVRNAAQAKELGLVDDLFYRDQFLAELTSRLDTETDSTETEKSYTSSKSKVNFITYNKYRKSYTDMTSSENEIAVIVADGTIMPGEANQQDHVIGGDTFVEELRKAREDKDVKAIVVRINSPGGEFRASDMMWREIKLATAVKPVIASMSDYAASGGYYMAMACDTIVAQPHTITGSIGIFGLMFDMSGFLGNKIGVTSDEAHTGDFRNLYTVTRPLTDVEKSIIQKSLDDHYETFTTKAAEGRDVAVDDLKKVASGRVWTGEQALERNLVDVLGGLNDAVRIAAESAGVDNDYELKYYPATKNFIEEFVQAFEEDARADKMKAELGDYYIWYKQVQELKQFQGVQARMPFQFEIH